MDYQPSPFIFFLTLNERLPSSYYHFDKVFKDLGFILVPVRIDQLQGLISSTDQEQIVVISSVMNSMEFKIYHERVRGMLKYILKSKRISFMHLSSFSKLNDARSFSLQKNYFFIRYPVNPELVAKQIVRFYHMRSEQPLRWPGGKRAGVGNMI
jgi:hypothetical protein